MFDINSLRTSEVLENTGVWRDVGGGAKLLLARTGNAAFSKMFSEMVAPYAETKTAIPEDVQRDITTKCLSRTILLGWKGVYDGKKKLPYSVENAERVLVEVKDFREMVIRMAGELEFYKDKNDKAVEGNLKSASDGSSSGETS